MHGVQPVEFRFVYKVNKLTIHVESKQTSIKIEAKVGMAATKKKRQNLMAYKPCIEQCDLRNNNFKVCAVFICACALY